jgi:hypothetical protein
MASRTWQHTAIYVVVETEGTLSNLGVKSEGCLELTPSVHLYLCNTIDSIEL